MTTKKVSVAVVGRPMSGKTTVIMLLQKALEEAGIKHQVNFGLDGPPNKALNEQRIKMAAKEVAVSINEFQSSRRHQDDPDEIKLLIEYDQTLGYLVNMKLYGHTFRCTLGDHGYSQEKARALAERMSAELGVEIEDTTTNRHDWVQPQ